jgi:murein DD-endopeptidase MepM/ murein hydrolase activator NlpD
MTKNRKKVFLFRLFYFTIVIVFTYELLFDVININEQIIPDSESIAAEVVPTNEFGITQTSLIQKINKVKKNQTLSDILQTFQVNPSTIHQIAANSNEIFDVRHIKAGKTYHAFIDNGTSNSLHYFVYEKDPVNYVVYDFRDSLKVYEGEKQVVIKQKSVSAIINESLYLALSEVDAPSELAVKLSQIFAWQIDFYQLQKGDNFKVIYEEKYIPVSLSRESDEETHKRGDDVFQLVSLGKILAACFQHNGKNFYAIPFEQDSSFQYFDENGKSLRKTFLKAPLEFSRISSRFSYNRLHPVLSIHRPHLGVDYAAPVGTPVHSTGDGVVVESGYERSNGWYIKIKHNSVYTTMYLHLSKFAKEIKIGSSVKQGQVIGYVGSTGLSTGPHLDYRFYVNGKPVDPIKVEVPSSTPVKEDLRDDFEIKKNELITSLKLIDAGILFADNPYVLKKLSSK